jgi:Pentapeptide repeats (9 copies)/Pentapeptide repeats (8 copies)
MFKKHWKFFVPILVVFALGGFYWKYQQCRIEPMIQQINSLQVDLNKKIDPKDRVLIERDRIVLQNALDSSVLQFASGLFFVITAFIAWLNLKATEEKQITERFKAVEQLGSDKLEVRIGSIYSLERIAKDSPKDHWTVMEVLTSFVRDQSSKGKSVSELKVEEKEEESLSTDSSIETTLAKINAKHTVRVTSDIQAALTVICRRNQSKDEKGLCLDLSFSDIRGADLRKARLRNVDFRWTNVSGANLEYADLIDSKLQNADLTLAKLNCAKLKRAKLNHSIIHSAYLEHTQLEGADLTNAKLDAATLQEAKLNDATLHFGVFQNTKLQGTDFSNAKFKRTDLREAQLDDKTKLDEKWRQIHQINIRAPLKTHNY